MKNKLLQFWVGVFILAGMLTLLWMALRVSGLTVLRNHQYTVSAEFDNIGSLKLRAPVKLAGVVIGRVVGIQLDQKTFRAKVTMQFGQQYQQIPEDSVVSIYTAGLLGANYINLSPGYEVTYLKPGGEIMTTHSAIVLENLIGQLIFKQKKAVSKN